HQLLPMIRLSQLDSIAAVLQGQRCTEPSFDPVPLSCDELSESLSSWAHTHTHTHTHTQQTGRGRGAWGLVTQSLFLVCSHQRTSSFRKQNTTMASPPSSSPAPSLERRGGTGRGGEGRGRE